MARKAVLFLNSKATRGDEKPKTIIELLAAENVDARWVETKTAADFRAAIDAALPGLDLVIAAGGDGTVKCVADALHGRKIPLGVVPLGAANNFARGLGIPLDVEAACRVIARGRTVPVDLARVNDVIFVSVSGIGISAEMHKQVHSKQKKRWGGLSYVVELCRTIWGRRKSFRVEVQSATATVRTRAAQVTICNGPFWGGHVQIHPDASLTEGLLDLSIIESKRLFRGLLKSILPGFSARRSPGLQLLRAPRFIVKTSPTMTVDVEGGSAKVLTPATFEVLPAALLVRVPDA